MLTPNISTRSHPFDNSVGYGAIADFTQDTALQSLFQPHESRLQSDLNRMGPFPDHPVSPSLWTANHPIQSMGPHLAGPQLPDSRKKDNLTGLSILGQSSSQLSGPSLGQSSDQLFTADTTSGDWHIVSGSLDADSFTADSSYTYNVFSGNGNVDFGRGEFDLLDLSTLASTDIEHTLEKVDLGNGARMFDALQLNNGNYIFFEGIDTVQFSDTVMDLSVTPNDPYFNTQWNLHMMGVHTAWRFTTGTDDILIGVQDTGLATDFSGNFHPDLNANQIVFDSTNVRDEFFRNVPDAGYGPQYDSHGTAVQGIIAAASDNGIGISGINWNSDVFAIDVLDANVGDQTLVQATNTMIQSAQSQNQKLVINMSLGGSRIDPAFEQLVASVQDDVLFVIAAGNSGSNSLGHPASLAGKYDNVIAVGASWGTTTAFGTPVDPGTRISYPGFWGSNYGTGLSIMGPSEVPTTNATNASLFGFGFESDFGYGADFNGTSAAAPNVAGVASLVWSVNADLSAASVKEILMETAYDLGAEGYDPIYGSGFVNADAAVRRSLALA